MNQGSRICYVFITFFSVTLPYQLFDTVADCGQQDLALLVIIIIFIHL